VDDGPWPTVDIRAEDLRNHAICQATQFSTPPTLTMSDFAAFQSAFKGDLITPEHPEYEKALTRWAANSRRRAAIVAFVRDEADVTLALKYAKKNGLAIAIRGGGHNPAGASSVEGGLVIDLSRHLSGTRVDTEKKLAYVGGGAIWEGVNAATMKHNLATTGGTVSHTGVGGLTLGGGFGYLSGSHGLVIDNLVQATVVIADGTVLTASDTENSDLFWGIRGGGSNFGVVTEFVLKVYPQRRTIYSGFIIYPASALDAIMKVILDKHEKGFDERESFVVALSLGPDANHTPAVTVLPFYNGSEEEGRKAFKPFLDIEPKIFDQTREMPYEESNTLLDDQNPIGNNYYLKSVDQLRPDAEVAKKVAESVYSLSREHSIHITYIFEFWNLNKINTIPVDATAFQRSPRLSSVANIQYSHDTPEQLAIVRKAAEHISNIVTSVEGNANLNNGYANYNSEVPVLVDVHQDEHGSASSEKTKALFGPKHERLAALKQKYDPELIFNKWYVIKPAGAAK